MSSTATAGSPFSRRASRRSLPIPAPLVWGLLAFITNYIPNIGFVLGLIPPALLGLLEGGPRLMLVVIAVFLSWLTAVSWPALSPASRALRVVVNLGILAIGIARLVGWI